MLVPITVNPLNMNWNREHLYRFYRRMCVKTSLSSESIVRGFWTTARASYKANEVLVLSTRLAFRPAIIYKELIFNINTRWSVSISRKSVFDHNNTSGLELNRFEHVRASRDPLRSDFITDSLAVTPNQDATARSLWRLDFRTGKNKTVELEVGFWSFYFSNVQLNDSVSENRMYHCALRCICGPYN